MSIAIELIVAGYLKMKDRRSLKALLDHRREIFAELQRVNGINAADSVQILQAELKIIEAGLEQLGPPPGSGPDVI